MTNKLGGVIAAIATAIDETGAPDARRSVGLARYLLDIGCDGLNVLGTTGEATSFSVAERHDLHRPVEADQQRPDHGGAAQLLQHLGRDRC